MNAPVNLTIHEAADLLAAGDLTSRQLCEALIERRQRVDAAIGAFLHTDDEAVLAAADAADRRRAQCRAKSRFDGIPIAVKENINVKGLPCSCASRMLEGYIAPYDASVIANLRRQGMIIAGQTNLDEFAMGSSTETSAWQVTSNPWDTNRVPGGSSGGSAAAVAARMATVALGSDTGGSIRQPAGFCGIVGLKPTYGRVSRYGLVAYASSLDQIGCLTRDVHDAAIMLDMLGGQDPADSTSLPDAAASWESSLSLRSLDSMRIGVPAEYIAVDGLSPEVRRILETVVNTFESLGADIVEVSLPHMDVAIAAYYIIATAEASANLARFDSIRYGFRDSAAASESLLEMYRQSRAGGFGPEVKRRIILGTYVLSSGYYEAHYLKAQKVRTLIRNDFRQAFAACDLILAPVSPTPPFLKGSISTPLEMYLTDIYNISANMAGLPGLTLRGGLTDEQLPVGVQLMGPALAEATLLQAGHAYEKAVGEMPLPDL